MMYGDFFRIWSDKYIDFTLMCNFFCLPTRSGAVKMLKFSYIAIFLKRH